MADPVDEEAVASLKRELQDKLGPKYTGFQQADLEALVRARVTTYNLPDVSKDSLLGVGLPPVLVDVLLKAYQGGTAAAQRGPDPAEAVKFTSQIKLKNEFVGSLTRLTPKGLCVGATHTLVEQGKFLPNATAFDGQPLALAGSSPYHDIIFVWGPEGPHIKLDPAAVLVGKAVALAGYPLAPLKDLSTKNDQYHAEVDPLVAHGRVVLCAATGDLAAADYGGAMPNASGGAVLASNYLAGVHLGVSYHLDSSYQAEEAEVEPASDRWDADPENMWQGSRQPRAPGEGKRRASEQPGTEAAADQEKLVLHAVSNIPHKGHLALFVPSTTIVRLAQRHGLLAPAGLDAVQHQHAAQAAKGRSVP